MLSLKVIGLGGLFQLSAEVREPWTLLRPSSRQSEGRCSWCADSVRLVRLCPWRLRQSKRWRISFANLRRTTWTHCRTYFRCWRTRARALPPWDGALTEGYAQSQSFRLCGMWVVHVGVYLSGCVQLACQLVSIWSPFHLGCNRTLYQFLLHLNTMIRCARIRKKKQRLGSRELVLDGQTPSSHTYLS